MTDLKTALNNAVTHLRGVELPIKTWVDLIRLGAVKTTEFYLNTLIRLVRSVYQGYLGGEFIDIMANLVQGQINQAYGQAWIDEGDGGTMPEYLLNAAQAFILQQYGYVDQYYRDIVDARIDKAPIDPLLQRAEMWAGQYDTAYRDATLLIRTENGGNLVWRKGQTEQGCDTCARLDGLVMSAKDWDEMGLHPRDYPNPQLACEGGGPANHCDCELLPTDQRRSPNARSVAMDIVMGTRKG